MNYAIKDVSDRCLKRSNFALAILRITVRREEIGLVERL